MRSTAQLTSSPHPHQPSQLPGVRGGHSYTLQRETREGLTRTPERPPLDPFRGGRPAGCGPADPRPEVAGQSLGTSITLVASTKALDSLCSLVYARVRRRMTG